MDIGERDINGTIVVCPRGRIDAQSSKDLEVRFKALTGSGLRHIVVNLQGCDYISSGGLRVLLSTLKELKREEGTLRLCCLTPNVHKVFKLAGFTSIFSIHPSEEEALQA